MTSGPTPPPLPSPGTAAPSGGPPATPSSTPGSPKNATEVFDRIRGLGIVRPDDDRWVAGVAAGLARRSGLDPVLVRGGFVALSLFLGVGLFLYGVAWLLLPHPDGRIHAEQVAHGTVTAGFVGSVIAILSGMSSLWGGAEGQWIGWGPGPLPLIAVGVVIWWLVRHRRQSSSGDQAAPSPRTVEPVEPVAQTGTGSVGTGSVGTGSVYEPASPSTVGLGEEAGSARSWRTQGGPTPSAATGYPTTGYPYDGNRDVGAARSRTRPYRPITMITIGAAVLAGVITNVSGGSSSTTAAVSLAVVGLGLLAAGLSGRRGGLLVPVGFVLALVALGPSGGPPSAAGEVTWTPFTVEAAEGGYELGAGEALLDLTAPGLLTSASTTDPVTVPVQMGAGELTVVLPRGVTARVEGNLGAGEVVDRINNRSVGGLGRREEVNVGTGSPVLVVTVNQGVGQVTVTHDLPAGSGPAPSGQASSAPASPASSASPSLSPQPTTGATP